MNYFIICTFAFFTPANCFSWDYITGLVQEFEKFNQKYYEKENTKKNELEIGYFLRTPPNQIDETKVEEKALVNLISLAASDVMSKSKLIESINIEQPNEQQPILSLINPDLVDMTTTKNNYEEDNSWMSNLGLKRATRNLDFINRDGGSNGKNSQWLSYIPKDYSTIKEE